MQAATEMMHTAEMHLQEQAAEASFVLLCTPGFGRGTTEHQKHELQGPDKRAYESQCTNNDSGQSLVSAEPYSTLLFTPALRRLPPTTSPGTSQDRSVP